MNKTSRGLLMDLHPRHGDMSPFLQETQRATMATDSLSAAFAALLEVPALAEQLRRHLEIAEALGRPQTDQPLPPGVRPDIGRITAALALAPSFAELMKFADVIDLRDLNENELAYTEGLSLKTVRRWRTQGTGPEYRCEAGISYPIRWVWEWRERGRQRLTAQKKTRGWRE
jgi:hypothetical protein